MRIRDHPFSCWLFIDTVLLLYQSFSCHICTLQVTLCTILNPCFQLSCKNVPLSPQKAACFTPVFCLLRPISAPNSKVVIHLAFKTYSLIISLILSHFSPSCFQNFAGLPVPNGYHCALLIYSLIRFFFKWLSKLIYLFSFFFLSISLDLL